MNKEEFEKMLENANKLKSIQGSNGNFNFDNYMLGLYNGIETIIAIFEKRKPEYIDGHNVKFLYDKEADYKQALFDIREYVNTKKITEDGVFLVKESTFGQDILQIIDKVLGGSDER